jgi:tetratricopeptide (TPR) repeat protein
MAPRFCARYVLAVVTACGLVGVSACQWGDSPQPAQPPNGQAAPAPPQTSAQTEQLKDEIPATELAAVMTAHFAGLGAMEQYEYAKAVEAFREVHTRAPGWIPGAINLSIALLNDNGAKAEQAKKAGRELGPVANFNEALDLLAGVLARAPNHPYAHFCTGVILEQLGKPEANKHFRRVTEIDPADAAAWYWKGATELDLESPADRPDMRKLAKKQVPIFEEALKRDPYLVPALYRLQQAYRLAGEPKKALEWMTRWQELKEDRSLSQAPGTGTMLEKNYGYMGKYASVLNPFSAAQPAGDEKAAPRFDAPRPLDVKLAPGERWAGPADFTGAQAVLARVQKRFGAALAAFDADNDGRLDLYLAAAVAGPKGVRDALLLNKGDGRFEDASRAFHLPEDRASTGVAAGDFDADRHVDVFLTGAGDSLLLRNQEGKQFENVSASLPQLGVRALSLTARWLDLDQDGDLDLYIVNYCDANLAENAFTSGGDPPRGRANLVYRNDGKPAPIPGVPSNNLAPAAVAWDKTVTKGGLSITFSPWTGAQALVGGETPHCGIAALDIDHDRDIDLVIAADRAPLLAILNDRLGQFRAVSLRDLAIEQDLSGLAVSDFDADGRPDLFAASANGPALAWRNGTPAGSQDPSKLKFEHWPLNASNWRSLQVLDLDLDGWADLLGLPAATSKQSELALPAWARREPTRFAKKNLDLRLENPAVDGLLAVDLTGDPLADLLAMRPGAPPVLARNLGNGNHWLAVSLGGHWRVKPELMRTNPHGIGTRLLLEGQGTYVVYDHTTTQTGLAQSVAPVVLGLGQHEQAALLHATWPDAVMQCELNVASDQKLDLAENNRKVGSCPVLFAWNGRRFECIGDFLGGGGLGYLVAPGVYSQPDRDESVAISADQLQPSGDVFRLSVTEPMDEIAYLDHLRLEVVDRPPGVNAAPDERFAPDGPRPSGELIAWRAAIEPVRATDLEGRDLTETLRRFDRHTADGFKKLDGWAGYTVEHGIVLDFGDRLKGYKPTDELVLCLAGWVEYPYSQTNYAAATAGVALKMPAIERLGDDGRFSIIEPHAGYPAGLPRMTTLDLTGKLAGPRCVLRIKSNMECYYDQAFIIARDRAAEAALKKTVVPLCRATLGYRGYSREISPDGGLPLIYAYDYVDPAPLARFSGKLTRYGDVTALLRADDDQLCLVGPGDEVRLEFEAARVPALAPGWTRSYVLKTYGYCKDADPFSATSDTVEPIPWRGMPPFPFPPHIRRPDDAGSMSWIREYVTRPAGGGR